MAIPSSSTSTSDAAGPARHRRRGFAAALPLVCAIGIAHAGLRDEALHRALVGVWCNSSDGGRSCWAHDEFLPDGRFRACGHQEDDPRPFSGEGVVSVTGQRMCYRVTAASDNFWLRPGQAYCTDIVSAGPRDHVYRDIDTGAVFTLLRRPELSGVCPGGGPGSGAR